MKIISPSMLSCDFGKLVDEIEMVNQSEAGWFHLDIMDGVFVPNISFGTPILEVFMKYGYQKQRYTLLTPLLNG